MRLNGIEVMSPNEIEVTSLKEKKKQMGLRSQGDQTLASSLRRFWGDRTETDSEHSARKPTLYRLGAWHIESVY